MSARAGQRPSGLCERTGSLREIPFERLLFAAFREERTLALRLQKRQIKKTILLDRGAPSECLSNLRHETLGQFLLNRGRITGAEFKDALSEAACRQLRIGEVLVERGLLSPAELGDALRQNLAYKLLECFTWTEGEFRLEPWIPDLTDVPAIRTARVVFAGITKFVPQERVTSALGPILERPLVLTSQTRVSLAELRLSPAQERWLRRLRRPVDPHELFHEGATPRDELARTLYACSLMGLVAPVESLARGEEGAAHDGEAEESDVAIELDLSGLEAPAAAARAEIVADHRALARQGALACFGVPAGADAEALRARYGELCRRYAPERFEAPELAPVAELAAELLHATTSAYAELRGRRPVRGADPLAGGDAPTDAPAAPPGAAEPTPPGVAADPAPRSEGTPAGTPAGDETDPGEAGGLAEAYVRQARERMAGGNFGAATGLLTLALRSDPGNVECRIQRAYARFREAPEHAAGSLAELEEILATAPGRVLAHLYAAEIHQALEDFEGAAARFRAGCEHWARQAG